MGFTYTRNQDAMGRGVAYGTWEAPSGVSSGTIDTGLKTIICFLTQDNVGSISLTNPITNGIISSNGLVEVTPLEGTSGSWFAIGA